MSSGLDEKFAYAAPPGSVFFYNTPVYAMSKRIVSAAAGQPLETITRDWLTAPTGMKDTAWRERPAALASVGNNTGLVTTPHDVARFGLMVLHGGVAENGARGVSKAQLDALFTRSAANPAYGRLWWLNGGDYTLRAAGRAPGGAVDLGGADRSGGRARRIRPPALCGAQPQAGGGAHRGGRQRDRLRPAAVAEADEGHRLDPMRQRPRQL